MAIITTKPIILASSSIHRQKLLDQLGFSFTTQSPDIDETPLNESIKSMVERLSLEKALAIQKTKPHCIIIGSDQSAELNGTALTKPITEEVAIHQLSHCSGKTVTFHTGLCLLAPNKNQQLTSVSTEVKFRQLSDNQIKTYIKRESPLTCAGSFKCEGLGITLFKSIKSDDPTALVGLPLITLTQYLHNIGIDILTERSKNDSMMSDTL